MTRFFRNLSHRCVTSAPSTVFIVTSAVHTRNYGDASIRGYRWSLASIWFHQGSNQLVLLELDGQRTGCAKSIIGSSIVPWRN